VSSLSITVLHSAKRYPTQYFALSIAVLETVLSFYVLFILRVAIKPFILNVTLQNVVKLSVGAPQRYQNKLVHFENSAMVGSDYLLMAVSYTHKVLKSTMCLYHKTYYGHN
jgi:hypothetical protein